MVDNNILKTLGKSKHDSSNQKNFKKFYGKMFKLDSKKEWAYWKRTNTEIQRLNLITKKSESLIFPLKKSDDYIIDFDLDERNQDLYALSHFGEILLKSYSPKSTMGVVTLNNERSLNEHYFTCLKISKDYDYMAIGSFFKSEEDPADIRIKVFMIMEDAPSKPKIKYLDEKLIPRCKENDKYEYIQSLDFSVKTEHFCIFQSVSGVVVRHSFLR